MFYICITLAIKVLSSVKTFSFTHFTLNLTCLNLGERGHTIPYQWHSGGTSLLSSSRDFSDLYSCRDNKTIKEVHVFKIGKT